MCKKFNKKVPTKESLPFLAQFPVKIPVPSELIESINKQLWRNPDLRGSKNTEKTKKQPYQRD